MEDKTTFDIEIDEANLSSELSTHAAKMVFVAEEAVRAQLAYDQFKLKAAELAARIDMEVRQEAEAEGKKLTEKAIENRVACDENYKKATMHLLGLKAHAEMMKARREAWKERGSMLVQLSSNKRAEMDAYSYDAVRAEATA